MKRRLFQLVVFLLLGAIFNVAVAWGCTLPRQSQSHPYERPTKTNIPRYLDDPVIWYCHMERRFGAVVVKSWPMWIHDGSGARLFIHDTEQDFVGSLTILSDNKRLVYGGNYPYTDASDADSTLVPAWSFPRRVRVEADALGEARVFIDQAWGWPVAAVRRGSHLKAWRPAWMLVIGSSRIDQDNVNEILLQRSDHIIWPGFAINTVFYAVLLWMLWLSPFVVRRVIRRKRGHCIKCGYDLRHAEHEACPECGVECWIPPPETNS